MPDPTYDDATGGLPPELFGTPDLASLQYPWTQQPPPDALQPGIGVPAAALDAAAGAAPVLGPQPEGAPPVDAGGQPAPAAAPGAPPPMPYGATPLPEAAGPPGPPGAGPAAPTVADLTRVSMEPPPTDAQGAAIDPLRQVEGAQGAGGVGQLSPTSAYSDEVAQAALDRMAVNNPAAYDEYKRKWEAARDQELAAKTLQAATDNKIKAQQNADAYNKAYADAQAKSAQLEQDWKTLANQKVDPNHWWSSASTGQKIAGFIAAVVGGLYQGRTGGQRNIGMDMIQKAIDEDVAAQQANIQNSRQILGARQNAVGEMFQRTGDMYRSAETARAAGWEATIQELQAQRAQLDPRGRSFFLATDALRDAYARQAAGQQAYQKQQFTNGVEAYKLVQKDREIAETERKNRADELAKLLKTKGGTGVGGATNPNYTVPTGFFDPFSGDPVMGKREIGGKYKEKEHDQIDLALKTYKHVQDGWARLAAIGDRIEYHKSLGESAWSKFKDTDAAAYDAATHSLVVNITKSLGDKLTQGQIDEQGQRIPQRTGWLENRDVGKLIRDAQQESDQEFSTDMNTVGINAGPIIQHAQEHRARIQPSPEQELEAAQAAAAAQPNNKDAQAALSAAEQRQRDDVAAGQKRAADTEAVRALPAPPAPLPENTGAPTDELAAVRAANRATTKYTQLHQKFWTELGRTDYRKGLKPGELAAAEAAQSRKVGELAREVLDARDFALQQRGKAEQFGAVARGKELGLDADEVKARTRLGLPLGDEPAAPAPPAPNPLAPNASYLPGADPFAPPLDVSRSAIPPPWETAPPKPKKGKR